MHNLKFKNEYATTPGFMNLGVVEGAANSIRHELYAFPNKDHPDKWHIGARYGNWEGDYMSFNTWGINTAEEAEARIKAGHGGEDRPLLEVYIALQRLIKTPEWKESRNV